MFAAILLLMPIADHWETGVRLHVGRLAAADVVVDRCWSQPDRLALRIYPAPDPISRDRDWLAVSTSRRLDLRVETCLLRWAPKIGFLVLEPVWTRHTLLDPLLPFIPPPECP